MSVRLLRTPRISPSATAVSPIATRCPKALGLTLITLIQRLIHAWTAVGCPFMYFSDSLLADRGTHRTAYFGSSVNPTGNQPDHE